MKTNILDRYDKTDDGKFLITIKVESYKSLFNEFDFSSSYYKRDLREDFVDYLIDCVEEIGTKNKFLLKLLVRDSKNEEEIAQKFNKALKHYFYYLIHLSRKNIKNIVSKITFNVVTSVLLLIVAFFATKIKSSGETILSTIFNEGLYIAIWVLMWPVFSDFIYDIKVESGRIKTYKRISQAEIKHEYI